jgi:hypothetical protein
MAIERAVGVSSDLRGGTEGMRAEVVTNDLASGPVR